MAIVFNSTVSASGANSYASVADLNQYRENLGLSVLSESAAQVALIRATSWLDNCYRAYWKTQKKAESTQALHWPQDGAKDFAGTTMSKTAIPAQVQQAVYEYAIRAESQTTLDPVPSTNVKSQELEGLGKQEFFNPKNSQQLPDDFSFIDTILTGLIVGRPGGARILRLERA